MLPLYYPNLFVTSQVRNTSKSLALMTTTLYAIKNLLDFSEAFNINIQERFSFRIFLNINELDAICDYAQQKQSSVSDKKIIYIKRQKKSKRNETVKSETAYTRISVIAQYTDWLAKKY